MKNIIMLLLSLAILASATACAAPAAESTVSEKVTQPEAAMPSPVVELMPEPTPTSTLPPEEIERQKVMDEVQNLYRYYQDYNDYYAFFRIKEIYAENNLPNDALIEEIDTFYSDFRREDLNAFINDFAYFSALINGRSEEISKDDYEWFILYSLTDFARTDRLFLCFFDNQEQRDRIEAGVKIVDKFIEDPNDENTEAFEELILSDDLTDEERIYLMKWESGRSHISKEGRIYDYESYTKNAVFDKKNNLTYSQYQAIIQDNLFERNNTPNSEDKMTSTQIAEIIKF